MKMANKPAGDLGSMAISKTQAAESKPFAATPPAVGGDHPRSLTIKLDAATYLRLREHCLEQERATGQRATHQQVVAQMIRAALGLA
jgi:hypothetical protein